MTEPKRPLKVFLCQAHSDRYTVRALYSRLTKDGVDAWLDKEKPCGERIAVLSLSKHRTILPGQAWELEIRNAVNK
jgi:hypothetical protein